MLFLYFVIISSTLLLTSLPLQTKKLSWQTLSFFFFGIFASSNIILDIVIRFYPNQIFWHKAHFISTELIVLCLLLFILNTPYDLINKKLNVTLVGIYSFICLIICTPLVIQGFKDKSYQLGTLGIFEYYFWLFGVISAFLAIIYKYITANKSNKSSFAIFGSAMAISYALAILKSYASYYSEASIFLEHLTHFSYLVPISATFYILLQHKLFKIPVYLNKILCGTLYLFLVLGTYLLPITIAETYYLGNIENIIKFYSLVYVLILSTKYQKIWNFLEEKTKNFLTNKTFLLVTKSLQKAFDLNSLHQTVLLDIPKLLAIEYCQLFTVDNIYSPQNKSELADRYTNESLTNSKHAQFEFVLPLYKNNIMIAMLGFGKTKTELKNEQIHLYKSLEKVLLDCFRNLEKIETIKYNYKKTLENNQFLSKQAAFAKLTQGIAHEIKNPLGMLQSGAIRLKQHQENPELIKKFTDIIIKNIDQTLSVCDMMLNSANTKCSTSKELTNVNNIIKDIIDLAHYKCKKSNITIHQNLNTIPDITISKNRLHQALLNLTVNAIEAIKTEGKLTFETCLNSENKIQITIKDTGCGIKPSEIDYIFEPYINSKKENIGLGLALVKEIILEHNGTIDVKSEYEKGSKFIIILPT